MDVKTESFGFHALAWPMTDDAAPKAALPAHFE